MRRCPALLALLLAATLAAEASGERVVAIADIHGALEPFTALLRELDLVDDAGDWAGGTTTLVQTGDFLDRGVEMVAVMELLMKLQEQAAAAGGAVHVLLGNHEAMNLLGFTRDVDPAVYEQFRDADSERLQSEQYRAYRRWHKQRRKRRLEGGEEMPEQVSEAEWRRMFPPGYFEYLEAVGPQGRYGEWLRRLPAVHREQDTLFLHGGISPTVAPDGVQGINAKVREELERFESCRSRMLEQEIVHPGSTPLEMAREGLAEIQYLRAQGPRGPPAMQRLQRETLAILGNCVDYADWYILHQDGPLWFRGYARWTDEEGESAIGPILEELGAARVAVGHTVQKSGRIESRFDHRVFLMDTGMLAAVYEGRPSALVLEGDTIRAVYLDRRDVLSELRPARAGGAPAAEPPELRYRSPDGGWLPFRNDDEVLAFLHTADVRGRDRVKQGINRPYRLDLEKDGVRARAVFRSVGHESLRFRLPTGRVLPRLEDSYRFEPAAYWMSRMFGWNRVPPAVLRRVNGVDGSLQIWLEGSMTEDKRREEKLSPPDSLQWIRQRWERQIFDNLIANVDRNTGNLIIDQETWDVWWIDHTRSFVEMVHLPEPDKISRCGRRAWEALRRIPDSEIEQRLSEYLSRAELRSLLARRKALVELLSERLEERGEEAVLFADDADG